MTSRLARSDISKTLELAAIMCLRDVDDEALWELADDAPLAKLASLPSSGTSTAHPMCWLSLTLASRCRERWRRFPC